MTPKGLRSWTNNTVYTREEFRKKEAGIPETIRQEMLQIYSTLFLTKIKELLFVKFFLRLFSV
jgi:hypothetical protein